jgi:adenylate cyclase
MRRARDVRLCALALLLAVGFGALHLVGPDLRWVRLLELYTFDLHTRLRGPEPVTSKVAIVIIDDRSIRELHHWPVPRHQLAHLVELLHSAGAKAIGLDILFAEPEQIDGDGAGDEALAEAMRRAGNVVIPFAFRFGGSGALSTPGDVAGTAYVRLRDSSFYHPSKLLPSSLILPLPKLAEAANLGHMLIAFDVDGVARYEYPAVEYDIDYYPSMAIRLAQLYFGIAWRDVLLELGSGIFLGSAHVPTDPEMRILIDYPGPPGRFTTYPLSAVLAGAVPSEKFHDHIVLVGVNVVGANDAFASPFTAVMPGVERLASVLNSIVANRYLTRPTAAPSIEVVVLLLMAFALGLSVSRLTLAGAAVIAVVLISLLAVSSQVMLSAYGIWQATAVPTMAVVVIFVTLSLYRFALLDRAYRHIRRSFQRYMSPEMVERLAESGRLPELGGEMREITVLFCDLRGFTALSERTEPTQLVEVLNAFFTVATEVILNEGGTIDKYIGDEIMAFWNAPIEQQDHALRACRAALAIVARVKAMVDNLDVAIGREGLVAGIGINTGRCIVGNFGAAQRFDYSAIGDAVNVAARLQAETKNVGHTILLGSATAAQVDFLGILPVGLLDLRGRAEPMEAYALLSNQRPTDAQGLVP